jgi:hypothetical protein
VDIRRWVLREISSLTETRPTKLEIFRLDDGKISTKCTLSCDSMRSLGSRHMRTRRFDWLLDEKVNVLMYMTAWIAYRLSRHFSCMVSSIIACIHDCKKWILRVYPFSRSHLYRGRLNVLKTWITKSKRWKAKLACLDKWFGASLM